jgi:PAT family beta-lactamase induction signal transducer AmpG
MSQNAQSPLKTALAGYLKPGPLRLLFLGFSSSVPYIMILGTLSVWLTELGFTKTVIGYFAIVSIAYPCKFLLAPYVDRWCIPYLHDKLGHRRSWIFSAQLCVAVGLITMGWVGPEKNIWLFAAITSLVGLSSAIYDIATEAYRIEIMERNQISYGTSMSGFGYRAGMLTAGAGALYLSAFFDSWALAYFIIALLVGIGMITLYFCEEPDPALYSLSQNGTAPVGLAFLESAKHFMSLPHAWALFSFILIYKLNDSMIMMMSAPFAMNLGFGKIEIANIVKILGTSMMTLGVLCAGFFTNRFGSFLTLRFCIVAVMGVSGLFITLSLVGHSAPLLAVCMAVEHFTSGMFATSLIAFMCSQCRFGNAGTDYAFISSFSSLCRVMFSFVSGYMADQLGWTGFFALILLATTPGLYLINRYKSTFDQIQGTK